MTSFQPLRIALVQDVPGIGLRYEFKEILLYFRPDILAFPEYFLVESDFPDVAASAATRDRNLSWIGNLSIEFDCLVIGGSIVDTENGKNYNRCYLIEKGTVLGHYDKMHLFRNEGQGLISPGNVHRAFQWGDYRIGLLICADVLYPESFQAIGELKPDLIFIPTTSPYKPAESREVKFARDIDIYAKGAAEANAVIFKISASGSIVGHRLQGRSLIAVPGQIRWRVQPENEDQSILVLAVLSGDKRNPSLDIETHFA
jgi:predicted amidohydrolase